MKFEVSKDKQETSRRGKDQIISYVSHINNMFNESMVKPSQNYIKSDRSDAKSKNLNNIFCEKSVIQPQFKGNGLNKKLSPGTFNSDKINAELKVILSRQEALFIKMKDHLNI